MIETKRKNHFNNGHRTFKMNAKDRIIGVSYRVFDGEWKLHALPYVNIIPVDADKLDWEIQQVARVFKDIIDNVKQFNDCQYEKHQMDLTKTLNELIICLIADEKPQLVLGEDWQANEKLMQQIKKHQAIVFRAENHGHNDHEFHTYNGGKND